MSMHALPDQSRYDDRRRRFRELHRTGCFVIPNPWNAGSARLMASIGFEALATTSSGAAWNAGRCDGSLSLPETLANLIEVVEATDLPVNSDFRDGFGRTIADLQRSVRKCVATGVAGLSIEDATGDAAAPLYRFDDALVRLRAARKAIDATGASVMLIGRAECLLPGIRGPDSFDEAIRRIKAYAAAGADCLYAPGLRTMEEIDVAVEAVSPKPLNVLIGSPGTFSVQSLAMHGVRRISVGGALASIGLSHVRRAAIGLRSGSFAELAGRLTPDELSSFVRTE